MRIRMNLAALTVVALVVACGDQQDRGLARPVAPGTPSFALHAPPNTFSTTCSFTTASQLAGSYFTNNDTAKVVRSLISSMKSAGAGTPTATNLGFDVFTHVSANISADPDFTTGSSFVNEIIKCMFTKNNQDAWPASYTASTPGPEDFTVALDATQDGAFEVRGGGSDSPAAVLARLSEYSGVGPASGTWNSVLSTRVLFYGRRSIEQFGIDSNTFYNWRIVARNTVFNSPVIVGLCISPTTNDFGGTKAMVRRQDQVGASFLPFADATFIHLETCTGPLGSLNGPLGQLAAGAFKLGTSLFGPRPLSATGLFNPGGLAGATGGIHTDYGPDSVVQVDLSFTQQPHDARVCAASPCQDKQTFSPVTVLATWHGLPVGGVQITLLAINNNGTPAQLLGVSTLVTGEDGKVNYVNLGLTKPGGYALLTNAELVQDRSSQIVIPHVTSTKFNIRP